MFNFDIAKSYSEPFPYLFFDKVFNDNILKNLINEFPSSKYYENLILSQNGRFDFGRWNKDFEKFIFNNITWNKLYSFVQSESFINQLLKIFNSSLHELNLINPYDFILSNKIIGYEKRYKLLINNILQHKKIIKILEFFDKREPLAVSFNITTQKEGYDSPPHVDARYKICAFLIYLDDCVDDGFLRIYKTNKSLDKNLYFKKNEVKEIKKILPKRNKGILIFNNKRSVHSANFNKNNPNSKRSFIYISIASARRADVWK